MAEPKAHIAAIVLAAGASTRLGTAKQLIDFRGEPLVRRAANAALDAGASPVVVVLGAESELVARAVSAAGVSMVLNDQWRDGLASSLAAGIREVQRLDAKSDAVLILTADQPFVDSHALRTLADAFGVGERLVAASYSGTVGVPAVIGSEHWAALLALEGDSGAGKWLRAQGDRVRHIPLPAAAVDIDTAEDRALLAAFSESA